MQQYRYKARRTPGELEEGVLAADTPESVTRSLAARGLYAVSVQAIESEGRSNLRFPWGRGQRRKTPVAEQALVARQLGDLIAGGLTVDHALSVLEDQVRRPGLTRTLQEVRTAVRDGRPLSAALETQGYLFPSSVIGGIRAGEASGALDQVLQKTADLLEMESDLRRKVLEALTYPALLATVGAITLTVLFTFVLPRVSVLYADMGQLLPLPTRVLLGLSRAARWLGLPLLLLAALATPAIVRKVRRSSDLRQRLARRVLELPLLGRILLDREIVRFSQNMSMLVEGGVPVVQALDLSTAAAGNHHFGGRIAEIREWVRDGQLLGEALGRSALLAGPIVPIVRVGEANGRLAESLRKGAKLYEKELESLLKRVTTLLEPVLVMTMGIIVAFIVFAMMLPILQLDLSIG